MRSPPLAHVHRTDEFPIKSVQRELEDIVFNEVDAIWVHHPHTDALIITVRVANSNIHKMLVDNGSAVDIIYLNTYKRMSLTESELSPMTSPLYGFIGDHVIPKGIIKLVVTMGEHTRVLMVMTVFLIVDCLSAFNGIIGRPLLKAIKVITSIYHLTIKFPTAEELDK